MKSITNEWQKYRDSFNENEIKSSEKLEQELKELEQNRIEISKAFDGLIAFEKRKVVLYEDLFYGNSIVNFFKNIFKTYIKKFDIFIGKKVWFTHFDFIPREVEIINVTDIGKSFVVSIKTQYYNIDNLVFPKTKKGLCKSVTTDEKCGIFECESDADEYFKHLSL